MTHWIIPLRDYRDALRTLHEQGDTAGYMRLLNNYRVDDNGAHPIVDRPKPPAQYVAPYKEEN